MAVSNVIRGCDVGTSLGIAVRAQGVPGVFRKRRAGTGQFGAFGVRVNAVLPGGIDTAIGKAEELAGVSAGDVQVRFYPEEEPFLRFIAHRIGITMKQFQTNIWLTEEERQLLQAAEYLKGFATRREFVQLLAPIGTEF